MQAEEEFLLSNWPHSPFLGHSTMPPTMKFSERRNHFCLCENRSDVHEAREEITKSFKDHKEKL
jgi:hypothetical protein